MARSRGPSPPSSRAEPSASGSGGPPSSTYGGKPRSSGPPLGLWPFTRCSSRNGERMSGASKDELHAIASRGAPELHDSYSTRALDRAAEEYRARRREKLTGFVPG